MVALVVQEVAPILLLDVEAILEADLLTQTNSTIILTGLFTALGLHHLVVLGLEEQIITESRNL